jgi:16S rRNA (guanine527-N7)-methyltransferase
VEQNQLLSQGFALLGFLSDDEQKKALALFEIYLTELELFNKPLKLTSASESSISNIIVRHIFDSLAALPHIALLVEQAAHYGIQPAVADIGSGGGFPGIPLAVCASVMPNLQKIRWTLIERMQKKCAFLQNCAALMKLPNVCVENIALEKAEKNRFAVCVFRAFHPLTPHLLDEFFSLTADGGFLAAYKARLLAVQQEMSGVESSKVEWRAEKLNVPFLDGHERCLVVIKKPDAWRAL